MPAFGQYVPAPHATGLLAPAGQWYPALHCTGPAIPSSGQKYPAVHSVIAVDPEGQ